MTTKTHNFKFYEDAGHGWMAVKAKLIVELCLTNDISTYSYIRGGTAYLEEDCDAQKVFKACRDRGIPFTFRTKYVGGRSPIRSYDYYTSSRCVKAASNGLS